MNVIWKEKKGRGGPGSARVELVFTPSDVVDDLKTPMVIGISISRYERIDGGGD